MTLSEKAGSAIEGLVLRIGVLWRRAVLRGSVLGRSVLGRAVLGLDLLGGVFGRAVGPR